MHLEEAHQLVLQVPPAPTEAVAVVLERRPPVCAANDEDVKHRELADRLPALLPGASAWVQEHEARVCAEGRPLPPWQREDARRVGVRHPERVRVQYVDVLPEPADSQFRALVADTGFLASGMAGLAFGYGLVILRRRAGERRLLRHQLRHVAQFEAVGSAQMYFAQYLRQIAHVGYDDAPFEREARRHEAARG